MLLRCCRATGACSAPMSVSWLTLWHAETWRLGPLQVNSSDWQSITRANAGGITTRAPSGFREGTRDHDVSQNIDALLRHIEGDAAIHYS